MIDKHQLYIKRCIDLASKGENNVKSNPQVGACLVHNDRIIGEGYHEKYGEAHAEVNAIKSVPPEHRNLISEATLYISLEPCNHHGKTPPCVQAILDHNIKNVIISALDTNPKMRGKSIEILKENGVNVQVDILKTQGQELLKRFESNLKGIPSITLKFAQSKDYFIGKKEERTSISGSIANIYTHKLRSEHEGIMIGTNTAIIDNPSLTTRLYGGSHPLRIVLDQNERIPKSHQVFTDEHPTIFITTTESYNSLEKEAIIVTDWSLTTILSKVYEKGIHNVLVEGGRKLLQSIIKESLWDKGVVITSHHLQIKSGVRSPKLNGKIIQTINTDSDVIDTIIPTS